MYYRTEVSLVKFRWSSRRGSNRASFFDARASPQTATRLHDRAALSHIKDESLFDTMRLSAFRASSSMKLPAASRIASMISRRRCADAWRRFLSKRWRVPRPRDRQVFDEQVQGVLTHDSLRRLFVIAAFSRANRVTWLQSPVSNGKQQWRLWKGQFWMVHR